MSSLQSLMRFLVRSNMRRIKKVGKEFGKAMKGEEQRGNSPVHNRVANRSGSIGHKKTQQRRGEVRSEERSRRVVGGSPRREEVGRGKERTREVGREVPRERYEEDPPVNKHIEHEIMKDTTTPREVAYAAVGELSAVVKKIVYWTNQTQVQEVLWYAIEHEQDRYVKHILETTLAQVERTPEPEV